MGFVRHILVKFPPKLKIMEFAENFLISNFLNLLLTYFIYILYISNFCVPVVPQNRTIIESKITSHMNTVLAL